MSNREIRNCVTCKKDFTIEPEDFDFYEKIKVPPPTWCPECRQQRRYAWRNERVLYRRTCDLCKKSIVTIYSPNKPYKVYCPPCWWGDGWDAAEYGQDFDFSRPFFEQFHEMQLKVPRIALLSKNSVNSEYTNHSGDNKNCYLSFGTFGGENDLYCTNMFTGETRDCMDCYHVTKGGDLLYECIDTEQSYNCQFGMLLRGCHDCYYSFDLRGCSDCIFSYNLRNKQYYIFNQPYSKEEYKKKLAEFNLGSAESRKKLFEQWQALIREKALHRYAIIENANNVSGNQILNARNVHQTFDGNEVEDLKYAFLCASVKTSMDAYHFGLESELIYETHGLTRGYNLHFTHLCYDDVNLQYCDLCHNSENLFGCVGIKKGSYMIFNKKYSESDYHALREKIIAKMKEDKEYGEFFPPQIAPVSYNETQGQIYMPLTKEEVLKRGWQWEDRTPGTFGKETLASNAIPDEIKDISDGILKEILPCVQCKKNYNIVEPELALCRRLNIPVPRLCSECRYMRRMNLRPPRKVWRRECMCDYGVYPNTAKHSHHLEGRCLNEFETPYAPERKEVVYCESCYNAEIV